MFEVKSDGGTTTVRNIVDAMLAARATSMNGYDGISVWRDGQRYAEVVPVRYGPAFLFTLEGMRYAKDNYALVVVRAFNVISSDERPPQMVNERNKWLARILADVGARAVPGANREV